MAIPLVADLFSTDRPDLSPGSLDLAESLSLTGFSSNINGVIDMIFEAGLVRAYIHAHRNESGVYVFYGAPYGMGPSDKQTVFISDWTVCRGALWLENDVPQCRVTLML